VKPLLKPSSDSNLYRATMWSPSFGLPSRNQITRLDLREREDSLWGWCGANQHKHVRPAPIYEQKAQHRHRKKPTTAVAKMQKWSTCMALSEPPLNDQLISAQTDSLEGILAFFCE